MARRYIERLSSGHRYPGKLSESDNLYQLSLAKLDFMKIVLFIDDVSITCYRDSKTN